MQEIIIMMMEKFGYIGVMFLVAIENVFPPIPSEVILAFGGFMTTYTKLNVLGMILSATIGAVLGAIILYCIGKMLNKERLMKLVSGKVGKVLFLKPKDIEKADHWFDQHGSIAVFFCRFVPIVRSLISIPAGMSDMSFSHFLALTAIGTFIWNTVLVILGSIMGEKWTQIVEFINQYAHVTLFVLLLILIVGIIYFYYQRIQKKKSSFR